MHAFTVKPLGKLTVTYIQYIIECLRISTNISVFVSISQTKCILQQMADASRASNLDFFQVGHVTANANLLVLAGHETTSTALTYTSYLLAVHPEVQERLAEEIDNHFQEHPVKFHCRHSLYSTEVTTPFMCSENGLICEVFWPGGSSLFTKLNIQYKWSEYYTSHLVVCRKVRTHQTVTARSCQKNTRADDSFTWLQAHLLPPVSLYWPTADAFGALRR